jgi:hypothetical protein
MPLLANHPATHTVRSLFFDAMVYFSRVVLEKRLDCPRIDRIVPFVFH